MPASARHQDGAATLVIVMVLLFVLMLGVAYGQRSLLFEQKASLNQYHATQAAEAARAGLDWALARLNGLPLDDRCQPANDGTPLRDRVLRLADAQVGSFQTL